MDGLDGEWWRAMERRIAKHAMPRSGVIGTEPRPRQHFGRTSIFWKSCTASRCEPHGHGRHNTTTGTATDRDTTGDKAVYNMYINASGGRRADGSGDRQGQDMRLLCGAPN